MPKKKTQRMAARRKGTMLRETRKRIILMERERLLDQGGNKDLIHTKSDWGLQKASRAGTAAGDRRKTTKIYRGRQLGQPLIIKERGKGKKARDEKKSPERLQPTVPRRNSIRGGSSDRRSMQRGVERRGLGRRRGGKSPLEASLRGILQSNGEKTSAISQRQLS